MPTFAHPTTAKFVERVPLEELVPFDRNPRKISAAGLEKIAESIRTFGFTSPVVAQAGTGLVIAGHQRLRAAKMVGLGHVPVRYLAVDDDVATKINVADNRLGEEADWDRDVLADLLAELGVAAGDGAGMGMSEDELRELVDLAAVEFEEFDESAADTVEMATCPKCGHEFPA